MKKIVIAFSVLLFFVAIGFYQFNRLGGFNEIEIEVIEPFDLRLQGLNYRGTPQDEGLEDAFKQIGTLSQELGIPFFTVYKIEPAGKLDTMEVFVGIEFGHSKEGLDLKKYESGKAILAKIKAHKLVMPGPNKVKNKLLEFAREKNIAPPNVFIDKIISNHEVHVIGLIQD